jgi:hypothetical protein
MSSGIDQRTPQPRGAAPSSSLLRLKENPASARLPRSGQDLRAFQIQTSAFQALIPGDTSCQSVKVRASAILISEFEQAQTELVGNAWFRRM